MRHRNPKSSVVTPVKLKLSRLSQLSSKLFFNKWDSCSTMRIAEKLVLPTIEKFSQHVGRSIF